MKSSPEVSAPWKRGNRFRSRSLCAAGALAASSGLADQASATIVFDLSAGLGTGDTVMVDGSAGSAIDLASVTGMMGELDLFLDSPGMMGGSTVEFGVLSGMGMDHYLEILSAGDTVDGTLNFDPKGFLLNNDTAHATWPAGTTDSYAGFRFDDGVGGWLYGWLRVQFDSSGTDFSVLQWAYEDSGVPIVVPEPGGLLLLALGAAGVTAWWRRRVRPTRLVGSG